MTLTQLKNMDLDSKLKVLDDNFMAWDVVELLVEELEPEKAEEVVNAILDRAFEDLELYSE